MTFEEFQHLARLYVIGGIEPGELTAFEQGRKEFGKKADDFIEECRRLEAAFALSLQPQRPRHDAKQRLLAMIRARGNGKQRRDHIHGKDRPLHNAPEGEI